MSDDRTFRINRKTKEQFVNKDAIELGLSKKKEIYQQAARRLGELLGKKDDQEQSTMNSEKLISDMDLRAVTMHNIGLIPGAAGNGLVSVANSAIVIQYEDEIPTVDEVKTVFPDPPYIAREEAWGAGRVVVLDTAGWHKSDVHWEPGRRYIIVYPARNNTVASLRALLDRIVQLPQPVKCIQKWIVRDEKTWQWYLWTQFLTFAWFGKEVED